MENGVQVELVIAWYDPAEWEGWRATCDDGETCFLQSFEEWRSLALCTIHDQRKLGRLVRAVPIRLAEFLAWASSQGLPTNTQTRAEFAATIPLALGN